MSDSDVQSSKVDSVLVAHAVFGSITALVLAPAGILLARYGRMWSRWAAVHRIINIGTLAFAIAAYATGKASSGGDDSSSNPHPALANVAGAFLLVQVALGILVKWRFAPPSFNYVTLQKGRHPIRYLHIAVGLVTAALLYGQIMTGIAYWNDTQQDVDSHISNGVNIAFWVLLGVEVAVYIAGWPLAELRARRRRATEAQEEMLLKRVDTAPTNSRYRS